MPCCFGAASGWPASGSASTRAHARISTRRGFALRVPGARSCSSAGNTRVLAGWRAHSLSSRRVVARCWELPMADGQTRVALLAGASGLTGAHVLNALLAATDFSRVIAVTRRPLQREHARLANRIVQFDRLESQLQGTACDVALCCLGSTRAQAGSREAFRKVDVDYVVAFARAALDRKSTRLNSSH